MISCSFLLKGLLLARVGPLFYVKQKQHPLRCYFNGDDKYKLDP